MVEVVLGPRVDVPALRYTFWALSHAGSSELRTPLTVTRVPCLAEAGAFIDRVVGTRPMFQVRTATGLGFKDASYALTENVCAPAARGPAYVLLPVRLGMLPQALQAAPSS